MTSRPILFSASMVRAIMAGRKWKTRRVAKVSDARDAYVGYDNGYHWFRPHDFDAPHNLQGNGDPIPNYGIKCPHGKPGDELWVRETWGVNHEFDHLKPSLIPVKADVHYRATDDVPDLKWRPSLFMMQHYSRLTLQITNVRVERLQDISEEDAKAEGVEPFPWDPEGDCWTARGQGCEYRNAFQYLWGEINGWNGDKSWGANRLVWVVEFAVKGAM